MNLRGQGQGGRGAATAGAIRRGQLDPNSCAHCKKPRQWKRQCPVGPQMTREFRNWPVWKPPSRENAEELAEFPQYDSQPGGRRAWNPHGLRTSGRRLCLNRDKSP